MRGLVLLAIVGLAAPAVAGTVRGTVELVEKGGRKATDLSEVVVYVEGARGKTKPTGATMTMKGKSFTPRVVVVGVGSRVDFPNEDPIFHNVFSVSGENHFDVGLYKRPQSGSWEFKNPGIAYVYCNIHPQMSGVVLVRDNPYFTKAAQDGAFVIEDVPAGQYALFAWQERAGEVTRQIRVPAQGEVTVSFSLDASSYKRVPHKNKFGKDYSDQKY